MKTNEKTLSTVMQKLHEQGFTAQFALQKEEVEVLGRGDKFLPTQLKIVARYHFDGMTNPSDEADLFAIKAQDGTQGTLVVSGQTEHHSTLQKIPIEEEN